MGNRAWRQRASRNCWGPYSWRVIRRHRWITEPPMRDPVLQPRPFTDRSLVGMTQGARKRAADRVAVAALGNDRAHAYTREYGSYLRSGEYLGAYWAARETYRIGERLRPCLGCCACWGADVSPAGFGYDAECFGPRVNGHTKREIFRMWKWQRNLVDDCDGSGVLPARRP